MSLKPVLNLFCLIALAGCGGASDRVSEQVRAVESQKGRWHFVQRNPPYPAMLVDTATGCVLTLSASEDGRVSVTGSVGSASSCGTMMDLSDMQEKITGK